MKLKRIFAAVMMAAVVSSSVLAFTACSQESTGASEPASESQDVSSITASEPEENESLEDGLYTAEFKTDSSMFHVNETKDGKCDLTVKDGKMTAHITLVSKKIEKVYVGKAEEAEKEDAALVQPTTDAVTYSDGETEEVYGFDIPVEKIGADFDLAVIGTKGVWYDHVVSVNNPIKNS